MSVRLSTTSRRWGAVENRERRGVKLGPTKGGSGRRVPGSKGGLRGQRSGEHLTFGTNSTTRVI